MFMRQSAQRLDTHLCDTFLLRSLFVGKHLDKRGFIMMKITSHTLNIETNEPRNGIDT